MAIETVAQLIDALSRYQLLEPAPLDELARLPQPSGSDPRLMARDLMRRSLLTAYQANQLLQGNAAELVLGPYVVLRRLGQGAMGQVFLARHRQLKRVVALKVLHKERLANPEGVSRFQREILASSQLSHRNIVMAYDSGSIEGNYYLAMEYVDGIDLSRLVKKSGPLPIEKACSYVQQTALGLQHAHERGLVHRDIKPANLLLATEGPEGEVVKILDMGLALLREAVEDTTLTQDGKVVGTPEFIAPEQARNSHTVDIRADLYSLGCTFYYLLCARPPFPGGGSVVEKLMKHQLEKPVPIESVRPEVPEWCRGILRRLITRKPEDRFRVPADLAAALDAALSPIRAAPPEQPTEAVSGDRWFYTHLGRSYGPVTTPEIKVLALRGDLLPEDLLWTEGTARESAVAARAALEFEAPASSSGQTPKWLEDVAQAEQARAPGKRVTGPEPASEPPPPPPTPQAPPQKMPDWLDDIRRSEGG